MIHLISKKLNLDNLLKIVLIYLVITFVVGNRGLLNLYSNYQQLQLLKTELIQLNIQKNILAELSKYNNDPQKLEYWARERLGLIKQNETVLYIDK